MNTTNKYGFAEMKIEQIIRLTGSYLDMRKAQKAASAFGLRHGKVFDSRILGDGQGEREIVITRLA